MLIQNSNRNILATIAASVALAIAYVFWVFPAKAESTDTITSRAIVGNVRLERIRHISTLLPDQEHVGFGSLLYDKNGELVLHDGSKTWLYTTGLFEAPTGAQRDWYGKWISYVREFDVKTLVSGERKIALGLADADRWAVIHDVIKVNRNLFVAFYSANGVVRAAIGETPDGIFKTV